MKTDNIRCILVDDELEGLDILEILLNQIDGVEVVSKISDSQKVISDLLQHKPDIVFLDINMPNKSGLELLKDINNLEIEVSVIFVTAFDQYVFDALKNSAFDYLVKPVDREELRASIERFKERTDSSAPLTDVITSLEGLTRIKIPINYGSLFFDPSEILYFQADSNYTYVYLANGSYECTSLNIGKLEEKLAGRTFFRISRSVIINLKFIYKLDRREKICMLRHDNVQKDFSISRQYIGTLDAFFDKF